MALEPIDDNAQKQPLTTALKNICRDYPAGGTVIRELLQNADDAGATVVRFVLDDRTHPTDAIIHEKLKQYQGPALLAYNNATFTPEDFKNLARLGDSEKLHDGSTTGRFGRGFNSVYNWTDSPSIASRERLLILDPHEEWSLGGPVYDFVKNSRDKAMTNHMTAFRAVIENPNQQLNGTVIRIPLRTAEQAIRSRISSRETTVSEVREVLRSFASEFRETGLLFMKNVGKVGIEADGLAITIEIVNNETVRSDKLQVNNAVKSALKDPEFSFDHPFEIGIQYSSTGELQKNSFVVHHRIQGALMDLREWAKEQKVVPWVAVAAQIPTNSAKSAKGSIFTVLPLPILSSQPIHLHGLFSISPDRARMYQFNDRSAQDQTPAKWNDWLLQGPVSVAWTKLLCQLSSKYPYQSAFEKWPQSVEDIHDPFSNSLKNVLELIESESLAVWPTNRGYMTAKDGLLAVGTESTSLRNALLDSNVPVVYVPRELQSRAVALFKDRILCPKTLCYFLKHNKGQIGMWSHQTKHTLVEFVLSKPGFVDYDDLEIFPFEDGTYQAVGKNLVFVHRDEMEKELFQLEPHRNLDLGKLSDAAQRALKYGCDTSGIHSGIRYRSAVNLKEFCMSIIFKDVSQHQDMIVLRADFASIVSKVWAWIAQRGVLILDQNISSLWLLPMSNGYHRRVKPQNASSRAHFAPPGDIGKLMWKFDSKVAEKPLPLLRVEKTGQEPPWVSMLTQDSKTMPLLSIANAGNLVTFLQWLRQTSPLDDDVTVEDKLMVVRVVELHLPPKLNSMERADIVGVLRHLKVFQKVSWIQREKKLIPTVAWTNLNACEKSIGLIDGIIPVPEISGVQFLIADWASSSKKLLQNLELAQCLKSIQVIQDHIIPAWKTDKASSWSTLSKEQLSAFILSRFSLYPLELQVELRKVPLVPVSRLNGEETSQFALAADLIDPAVLELKELCFNDESVVPKENFLREFNFALRGCGLKTSLDEGLVEQRVHSYANLKHPLPDVIMHAERLLRSTCRWNSPLQEQPDSNLRRLAWLPTTYLNGTFSLKSSNECRGLSDRLLVSSQLPTLGISISPEWKARLGWDTQLPSRILISQLSFGIERSDRGIVDKVLSYIYGAKLTESLADELKDLRCVLANGGVFIQPRITFRPSKRSIDGYDRLQPYLANVEQKFWQDHEKLLVRLEVRDQLQLTDLLEVQKILEAKLNLDESDVGVAIEVLNHATKFERDKLMDLKVISAAGKFEALEDVNFDDLKLPKLDPKITLTHPDIPFRTIKKLGIVSLRESLIKGMLNIEDLDDEDEFDQRESVTTRIRDTLHRYPVEATFREYLANADDAKGASKVSWLLDLRCHPGAKLLTPETESLQGPAFLVHNDGIFSENDFNGFKNVGEGSKAQDKEAIGEFGRGSQTMYHWTDTPMVLSGNFLVILDPQRRVLPTNKFKGVRMAGVKLELSKLREACSDQLAPFEGLWKYTRNLDHYPGTIFRFPLRTASTNSTLTTSKTELNSDEIRRLMDVYFNEARISLIFLRKIRSIDFSILGSPNSGWSISRRPPLDEDAKKSFSELVICSFERNTNFGTQIVGKDKWWVVIEDLDPAAEDVHDNSRKVMKNVECGLAALISSTYESHAPEIVPPEPIQSRMFNTLPLPIDSDLPVHVHATFSLSGDRQSIAVDEYGAQNHASKNRYLLQVALPRLYLQFLDEIGTHVRENVFKFWPLKNPRKGSPAEVLCAPFWEGLSKSSRRLFPKAQMTKNFKRQAAELFTVSEAVFDFLPEPQSEVLFPLLMSLGLNLVRNIPTEISDRLKVMPQVKYISGQMLRELFQSKCSGNCLLKEMAKEPRIYKALFQQMSKAGEDLQVLDGCYVLPTADGRLTALNFCDTHGSEEPKYYVVSEEKLKLFQFASRHLVLPSIAQVLNPVLKSGKFNVEKLRLSHVKTLLELKPAVVFPTPEEDRWLQKFWEYWNGDIESSLPSTVGSFDIRLYRAKRDGVDVYVTPIDFFQFPAVVEPSVGEHQEICDRIPGLYRFDAKFMPKSVADNENSFCKKKSFFKLIRAIRLLAGDAGMGKFFDSHLDLPHIKLLQDLVVTHLSSGILDDEILELQDARLDVMSAPIWPSFDQAWIQRPISANIALMASEKYLLVPWMKKCARFIDPRFSTNSQNQKCLLSLGVKKLSIEVLLRDYVFPLPKKLSESHRHYFLALVSALSSIAFQSDSKHTILPLLKQMNLAVDGNCTILRACELFDHDEQIFTAAFRHERRDRFLHDDVASMRSFWVKVGLRHRTDGTITPGDYLKCLRTMALRLGKNPSADPHLAQDCQVVLSVLRGPNFNIQTFNTSERRILSQEKVFLSRNGFNGESDYRRNGMTLVASERKLFSLSEMTSYEYVTVCWSQTSFAVHEPAKEVLNQIPGGGRPKINMVWRHLQHMKDLCHQIKPFQLKDFLVDLDLTYEYLQDRLQESVAGFVDKESAVWLNLSTSDLNTVVMADMESCWYRIDQLVLSSSCDTGPIKAVKPGLMRYEKLLRALGCSSIIYPTVKRPELPLGYSVSKSLRKLRSHGNLFDITYCSEGKQIQAHRVVLAALSEKCAIQFSPRWPAQDVIKYDEEEDADDFLSYHALSTMIKYAYEDEIDWKEMEVADSDGEEEKAGKLSLLLDLHKGADCWLIPELKSEVQDKILLAGRVFMTLQNIIYLRDRAEQVGAKAVVEMCAEFIEENREAVEKVHGEAAVEK